jgi:hypothetical protein
VSDWVNSIAIDSSDRVWVGVSNGGISRVPLDGRLQVTPFFTSIWNTFFSPKLSLWVNLLLLIFLGTVALVVIDRRRAMAEQEPSSGKIQAEEKKISKSGFALRGAAGAVTVSLLAFLFWINSPRIPTGGGIFVDIIAEMILFGIVLLGIPVSLVLGPLVGIATGRVFKTRIGAFISGFLVQFAIEVPLLWLYFNG